MKIYISFKIASTAAGGGNNFLKFLKSIWFKYELLAKNVKEADVVLINSHHNILKNFIIKFVYPNKIYVHRINGKLSLHRASKNWDKLILIQNNLIANATIFQSKWSESIWATHLKSKKSIVIHNQCDPLIFKYDAKKNINNKKIYIFYTFSNNKNKGHSFLNWLTLNSANLNIELRIIGNHKLVGNKISQLQIAKQLAEADVLFFPAENESCSNVTIESLSVGLPVLALNSGGNSELVKNRGQLFSRIDEIPIKIKDIENNYKEYAKNARIFTEENKAAYFYEQYFKELLDLQSEMQFYKKKLDRFKLIFPLIQVLWIFIIIKLDSFKKLN